MQNLNWKLLAEIIGGILFIILLSWFFFFRSPGLTPAETAPQQTFGQGDATTGVSATNNEEDTNVPSSIQSPVSKQTVFKISDGPVAGAAFMQATRPTTTIARFVMQQNGHVLDLAIDSPGAVAHAASNTTIPGAAQVVWEMQNAASRQLASGAVLQYIDKGTIKSVALIFPIASTTASTTMPAPVRIQFLPDNLRSVAASPDGLSLAYLVATASGSDGYVARYDGTSPKKVFSLPLSQVSISWPSAQVILAVSKPAMDVPGMAFSISASSGAVSPLLYASGLTATADRGFNQVVYQSVTSQAHLTYAHNTKTNLDRPLSFDPIPEKCIWSALQESVMFCAVPLSYTAPSYLDLWHQGAASAADSIVAYNLVTGQTNILATPGSAVDGGVASDIMQMALSADEKYLLFVSKGNRSLWGVRLK
jgi:hypothetical protein